MRERPADPATRRSAAPRRAECVPGRRRARCYTRSDVPSRLDPRAASSLTTIVDIGITALLIYWLFSLIRGTRAVRLVIGVSVLVLVYALAVAFDLRLLTQILQGGAVVGLFALVVIFQPELRRALERIGRVGSFGWLLSPAESRAVEHVSAEVARAAAGLSADGQGALIVLERETGLEEVAETGVMIHGDVSADLLRTIFTPTLAAPRRRGDHPRRADRGGRGAPAAGRDVDPHRALRDAPPRRPRHHRADRRRRRRRVRGERPDQPRRARADRPEPDRGRARAGHLRACSIRPAAGAGRSAGGRPPSAAPEGRSPRLRELGRFVGRPPGRGDSQATRGRDDLGRERVDGRTGRLGRHRERVERRRPARPHPPRVGPATPDGHPHRPPPTTTSCRRWPPGPRGEADRRHHRP